jgi:hypothetical protein
MLEFVELNARLCCGLLAQITAFAHHDFHHWNRAPNEGAMARAERGQHGGFCVAIQWKVLKLPAATLCPTPTM